MEGTGKAVVRWACFEVGWGMAWGLLGLPTSGRGSSNKRTVVDGGVDGLAIEHTPASTLAMERVL